MTVKRRIARIERLCPPRSVVEPAPVAAVAAALRLAELDQLRVFDVVVIEQVQRQRAADPRLATILDRLDRFVAPASRAGGDDVPEAAIRGVLPGPLVGGNTP